MTTLIDATNALTNMKTKPINVTGKVDTRCLRVIALVERGERAAEIVTATPDIVQYLLSLNTNNRKPRPVHIDTLKRDINAGHWFLTNQGIGVTAQGVLVDGQNRLMAITEAGYPPVPFVLVVGLDDKSQAVVDRHAKRSTTDVLRLVLNQTVSTHVVAAANLTIRLRSSNDGFYLATQKASDFEVADWISENHEKLQELMPHIGAMRAGIAAALIQYADFNMAKACDLADQIRLGLNLTSTMPAYRLRQWVERNRGSGGNAQIETYGASVSACIAHARDEQLSSIRLAQSWNRLPKRKTKQEQGAAT